MGRHFEAMPRDGLGVVLPPVLPSPLGIRGGLIGGTFRFSASSPASVSFRIDTIDSVPWYLDGAAVPSGSFSSVSKDTTRDIFIGVSNPNIVSILFYNSTYTEYTGIVFDLRILSAMRPTGILFLYNLPQVTGSLSDLSDMRPASNLFLYNLPQVTGSLSDLSDMRPGSNLNLRNLPQVTGSLSDLSDMRPGSNLNLCNLPLVTGSLSDLSSMRPTGYLYLNSLPLITGSLSDLSSMRPTGDLYLNNNPLISDCGADNQLFSLSTNIHVDGCALTQTAVDNILDAVVDGGKTNGSLNLSGGTNSAPSAAGLASKATLEGRGWDVTVNT